MKKDKILIIIDANSLLHRAYHALPPLALKNGELVNAVYGFLLVLFRVINEFQPSFIFAAFDFPAPTFRHKEYKEYKAKRVKAPEEFFQQIPKIKEVLNAFEIPILEKEGYEADDIVATVIERSSKKGNKLKKIMVSGDTDILQLVGSNSEAYLLRRGVKDISLYDEKKVKESYGLSPSQLLDFKALKGDVSDNIPGVKGIGEKMACNLILKFGNIETLYEKIKAESALSDKTKEILLRDKDQAFASKKLIRLQKDVPIDFNLEKEWKNYDKEKIVSVLEGFQFYSLIKRLTKTEEIKKESPKKENLTLWDVQK